MSKNEWKIKKSESVILGRFETIYETVILPNEKEVPFSYVKIKEGVCVLPIINNEVALIKQYRHTIKRWEWELPAGIVEDGEDPVETAERELLEETGLSAKKMEHMGCFYPSAGSTTEKIHLFFALCDDKSDQRLEDSELIDIHFVKIEKLLSMINDGDFRHGGGIVAVSKYLLRRKDLSL